MENSRTKMTEVRHEPAQTYQLNVLSNIVGRLATPYIDDLSSRQVGLMFDDVIDDIRQDQKPEVPHTNPHLLSEAINFDKKLLSQLSKGPATERLSRVAINAAVKTVTKHAQTCATIRDKSTTNSEVLIDPALIAKSYGLPDLWKETDHVIREEAEKWSSFEKHPEVPSALTKKVDLAETTNLMRLMWHHVIETPSYPEVNTYLTDNEEMYHVFWAPLSDTLDYATPREYDRATQLSFDLPHNATHLAHLNAMDPALGAFRYDDNMAQRAYFEAVTVFSEYKTIQHSRDNDIFKSELYDILQPEGITEQELAEWMVKDRGYEFKLRAARYAADVLMLQGASFTETTEEISKTFNIPISDAEKETKKYLPWTGLGAVYSFGYKKLESLGLDNVHDAIVDENGNALTSWMQAMSSMGSANTELH